MLGGNVGIGITDPSKKLEVKGDIRAKEVVIESDGWSDYVFEEDYDLPTLAEVSSFIDREGHLPSVPSTEEVKKNGLHLGEMDATLLRKVEELTLYAIEQKRRADSLALRTDRQAQSLEQLRRENDRLRERLARQDREHDQALRALREKVEALSKQVDDESE